MLSHDHTGRHGRLAATRPRSRNARCPPRPIRLAVDRRPLHAVRALDHAWPAASDLSQDGLPAMRPPCRGEWGVRRSWRWALRGQSASTHHVEPYKLAQILADLAGGLTRLAVTLTATQWHDPVRSSAWTWARISALSPEPFVTFFMQAPQSRLVWATRPEPHIDGEGREAKRQDRRPQPQVIVAIRDEHHHHDGGPHQRHQNSDSDDVSRISFWTPGSTNLR